MSGCCCITIYISIPRAQNGDVVLKDLCGWISCNKTAAADRTETTSPLLWWVLRISSPGRTLILRANRFLTEGRKAADQTQLSGEPNTPQRKEVTTSILRPERLLAKSTHHIWLSFSLWYPYFLTKLWNTLQYFQGIGQLSNATVHYLG